MDSPILRCVAFVFRVLCLARWETKERNWRKVNLLCFHFLELVSRQPQMGGEESLAPLGSFSKLWTPNDVRGMKSKGLFLNKG